MYKVTDRGDKVALKLALSVASTNNVSIKAGSISASCRNAVVVVAHEHDIPAGKYTCRDYFLNPCDFTPARPAVNHSMRAEYLGQVSAAAAWQLQMSLAELTGHVFNTAHLKALSVLYKGDPIEVLRDQDAIFLILRNITLTVFPRVPTTNVLIAGLPVERHQALKELAITRGTSVNKIILEAIKDLTK